jgi:hypothetical protein
VSLHLELLHLQGLEAKVIEGLVAEVLVAGLGIPACGKSLVLSQGGERFLLSQGFPRYPGV